MVISGTKAWRMTTTPELEEDDLHYFCALIEERAGIHLKSAKRDLVKTRLRPMLSSLGMQTFSEYRDYLASLSQNDPEWERFVNALTTNKTDFFREAQHFSFLVEKILPEWLKSKQKVFNVWSAASSTGEEPYTLAMVLYRHLPRDRTFRILATDIDTEVLEKAANAVYPMSKKDEIPVDYHHEALDFGKKEAQGWFRIKPVLKEKVVFQQHNLVENVGPGEGVFDLILCRNVLIYFGQENIAFVQTKLFASVKSKGHLFIGHSESFQGIKHLWKAVGPAVFRKE